MNSKKNDPKDHQVVKAGLDDEQFAAFQEAIAGRKQYDAIGRIFKWFTEQPDAMQRVVLGEITGPLAAQVLQQVADEAAEACQPPRRRAAKRGRGRQS